jgi:ABC-type dipeptide/oligopeptide/nickel transport system permease component
MKIIKIKLMIALVLITLLFTCLTAYADFTVPMTQGGCRYIYSNNPEDITTSLFTIEQKVDKDYNYLCQYYHWNKTGSSIKFGIAIKNTGTIYNSINILHPNA